MAAQVPENSSLLAAIERNDVASIKAILDGNCDPAEQVTAILTLFQRAGKVAQTTATKSSNEQKKVIQILKVFLEAHTCVDAKTPKGETLLFLSIKHDLHEVAQFLVKRGADLDTSDDDGNTLAHLLVKNQIQRKLQPKAASAEQKRKHWKDADLLNDLLSKGANANRKNKTDELPLRLALQHELLPMIPVLIRHTKNLQIVSSNNGTILHRVLEMLRPKKAQRSSRVIFDEDDSASYFEPNIEYQITTIVTVLLSRGLSVDEVDDNGSTPLIVAAKLRKLDLVALLLTRARDVNVSDNAGNTALHYVLSEYQQKSLDVVREFASRGADLYKANNEGYTPVQLAARYKHKVALQHFKEIGADFSRLTSNGDGLLHLVAKELSCGDFDNNVVELLLSQGCEVNAKNNDGSTPLLVALQHQNVSMTKALIRKNADVNFTHRGTGWTPLHLAVQPNRDSQGLEKLFEESLDLTADLSTPQRTGRIRAFNPYTDRMCQVVRMLLRAGAKVGAEDKCNRSPVYYCVKCNNHDVLALLLEYGADFYDVGVEASSKIQDLLEYRNVREYLEKLSVAKLPTKSQFEGFAIDFSEACSQQQLAFRSRCEDEVKLMKDFKLNSRRTVYDILHASDAHWISRVASSQRFLAFARSAELEDNFPMYRDVILGKYYEAVQARSLLPRAMNAMKRLTGYALPDVCVNEIIRGMRSHDLQRIIVASKIMKRVMPPAPLMEGASSRRRRME